MQTKKETIIKKNWTKLPVAFLLFACLAFAAILLKAYFDGKFNSVDSLQAYIAGFGLFAPLILVLIQAAQVVVPVLPGFFLPDPQGSNQLQRLQTL